MEKCEIKDGVAIFPKGITKIDSWAFEKCAELVSVTIPDSVTEIGECAFEGCSGLKEIAIPSSVKKIDRDAFINSPKVRLLN